MTTVTLQTRIMLDDQGRAWVEGTNTRVLQIALDEYAHSLSPREIQAQHPHLSLAQIHAALTYYYEHQAEIDTQIQDQVRADEALRQTTISRAEARLRSRNLLG